MTRYTICPVVLAAGKAGHHALLSAGCLLPAQTAALRVATPTPTPNSRSRFIRTAEQLGFTVGEISTLLALQNSESARAEDVSCVTESEIAEAKEESCSLKPSTQLSSSLPAPARTTLPFRGTEAGGMKMQPFSLIAFAAAGRRVFPR